MSPSRIFRWCAGIFIITAIAIIGFKVSISPIIFLSLIGVSIIFLIAPRTPVHVRIYGLLWLCFSLGLLSGSSALDRDMVRYGNHTPPALQRVRERIMTTINHALPRANAALLGGMLIGARESLPQRLKEIFSTVGITHIIAVSGYNITIVASMLFAIFLSVGLRREDSAAWVLFGVALFVMLCGASAATVRAGIMGAVAIAARLIGRRTHASTLLLATALAMALVNPRILFDIGFQLSFAALAGLLYIAPLFQNITPRRGVSALLREVSLQTLCAQGMALPLVLWYFDSISLISPLANLLIVPIVPLVMGIGTAATTLGALGDALGASAGALSYVWAVPWLLLEYIIHIASFLASLPFASLSVSSPFLKMLIIFSWYSILASVVILMQYRKRSACRAVVETPLNISE